MWRGRARACNTTYAPWRPGGTGGWGTLWGTLWVYLVSRGRHRHNWCFPFILNYPLKSVPSVPQGRKVELRHWGCTRNVGDTLGDTLGTVTSILAKVSP